MTLFQDNMGVLEICEQLMSLRVDAEEKKRLEEAVIRQEQHENDCPVVRQEGKRRQHEDRDGKVLRQEGDRLQLR